MDSPLLINDGNLNTLKHYYLPLSPDDDDEKELMPQVKLKKRRTSENNLDDLFEIPPAKKKKKVSSCVGRACKEGGTSYISTNLDDASVSTHLIKIEVYDLKKISKIPTEEHWKHTSTRLKYYTSVNSGNFQKSKDLIYNISKEIADTPGSRKYHFGN